MRIGLDARTVYRPERRGTGKNLIDLYRHLAEVRPAWRVAAYHRERDAAEALLPRPFAEPRRIDIPGDRLDAWERLRLPLAAKADRLDALHCPANTCPGWMPVPTLVTIHDLIPLDMPEGRPAAAVRRFAQSVRTACRRARWIVTPSAYTRDRLVAEFGADAARVTVIPWPADSAVRCLPYEQWQPVLERYGIGSPYVLHFGAGDPRKNTRRVLEAWAQTDAAIRDSTRLLIVGLSDESTAALRARAEELGVTASVVLHGFAAEADISALLSAAQALIFPSLSEGYGLPILDAWTTGTPVLTSNVTSLPEVAGDAALLVNPTDPAAIADGITRLLGDADLRRELLIRGEFRRQGCTWRQTAERFAQAVEGALGVSESRVAAA